jgi:hypothetical protein
VAGPRGLQPLATAPRQGAVRDSEDVPPEELLRYVEGRLVAEAQAAASVPELTAGSKERNWAIHYVQSAILWLGAMRAAQSDPR